MTAGWSPAVRCVQPGIGPAVAVALWLGRWRRAFLRAFRPGHVARLQALRLRTCPDCRHDVVDGRDLLWVQNVCRVRFPGSHTVGPFRDRFGLVRLGRPELLAAAGLSALLVAAAWWLQPWLAPLAALPVLFAAWFFRDPERVAPTAAGVVVAPADGVLDDVRHEPACPFFAGPAWRLGIYLGLLDVHVQRAPVAGVVSRCEYRPGRHVPTVRRGVTDGNEQLLTWIRSVHGPEVLVRQIAGPLARRICSVLASGDEVATGQRFGLIKFGSRCELWLPAGGGFQLVAASGRRVRAGESVLARRVTAGGSAPPAG